MKMNIRLFLIICTVFGLSQFVAAQQYQVLADADMKRVVPTSFYFAGQSAETQLRNAAAATVGAERFIIAGLVDTSGYSTEISGKYEGFFITDSPIRFGSRILPTGAYGFGFAAGNTIRVFDLGSRQILSVKTFNDPDMKRPRPLQMIATKQGIRLYKGRSYVVIAAR